MREILMQKQYFMLNISKQVRFRSLFCFALLMLTLVNSSQAAVRMYPFVYRVDKIWNGSSTLWDYDVYVRPESVYIPDEVLEHPLRNTFSGGTNVGTRTSMVFMGKGGFRTDYFNLKSTSGSMDPNVIIDLHTVDSFITQVNESRWGGPVVVHVENGRNAKCVALNAWAYSGMAADFTAAEFFKYAVNPQGTSPSLMGGCAPVTPDNGWCAMETPALDFDFGTLSSNSGPYIKKRQDIKISCSADDISYHIESRGTITNGQIDLPNGLLAEVTINNGQPLETVMKSKAGSTTIPVEVGLSGFSNAEMGSFTHSEVLYINYD